MKRIVEGLTLQLLLMVATLPFILWWHLPLPLASLIGNSIYPLFLITFLVLSSLIFFCGLIGQASPLLGHALSKLSAAWHKVLTLPCTPFWLPLTAGDALLLLLTSMLWFLPPLHKAQQSITLLATLSAVLVIGFRMHTPANRYTLLCNKHARTLECLQQENGTCHIIDHGFLSRSRSYEAIVDHEVVPHLCWAHKAPATVVVSGLGDIKTNRICSQLCEWGFSSRAGLVLTSPAYHEQRHTSSMQRQDAQQTPPE
jgi:hypothetical protein